MEEYLLSHILDLAEQSQRKGTMRASEFLGLTEQGKIAGLLSSSSIQGAPFLLFGGHPESERNRLILFPDLESKESFLFEEEDQLQFIRLLKLTPRYAKEERKLGHRDYLGALMSLGIKRETIGDILYEDGLAYLYLSPTAAKEALEGLDSVGRVPMNVKEVPLSDCHLSFLKESIRLSVSSLRLDNVLSAIAHLSREDAKNAILGERVHLSLHENARPDTVLLPGERVSYEGWGKFIYRETVGESRKGKLVLILERLL